MDFSPDGILYALGAGNMNKSFLIKINCQTGIATKVGSGTGITLGSGTALTDMSFDQYGRLVAYLKIKDIDQNTIVRDQIGTINIATGVYTEIGETGINDNGNGIAFAPFTNYPSQFIYHAGYINLSSIDDSDGSSLVISALDFVDRANNRPRVNAMDADFLTNIIYSCYAE